MCKYELTRSAFSISVIAALLIWQPHSNGFELEKDKPLHNSPEKFSSSRGEPEFTEQFDLHGVTYTGVVGVPYQIKDVKLEDAGDISTIIPTLSQLYELSPGDTLKVHEKTTQQDRDQYTLYLWVGNAQVRIPLRIYVNTKDLRISEIHGALPVSSTLKFHHPDNASSALKKVLQFRESPPPDSKYIKYWIFSSDQSQIREQGGHFVSKAFIPGRGKSLRSFWSVGLELLSPIELEDGKTTITHEWFLVDPEGSVDADIVAVTTH
ncbi:hypothetical protein [Parahaliea aestuarii]|uniref:Uncharacterized protein n=1 Tax=Parahaliea aestuarii TaxID=1852021 RepID=A0A5C8ZX90_9GAMM|nr:hypothetical protein [Parahaliea aestuarii]TXS93086.1 hypothetical protein FVW59_04285 [Parahaliea aestuarii]